MSIMAPRLRLSRMARVPCTAALVALVACQGDGEIASHATHDAAAVADAVRDATGDPDAFVKLTRSQPVAACGLVESRGATTEFVVDMTRGTALLAGVDPGADALIATACGGAVAAAKGGEKSGGGGH